MEIRAAIIDHIDIPPRLRGVDEAKVRALKESIDAIGLQQPVTLWAEPDGPFHLVAGAHRLEAAKAIGWDEIDAVFTTADEIDRQLWEIDENLMRSELTPTQQAEHLAKRKELWEARQSGQVAPIESKRTDGRGHRSTEFASQTANATGADKRTINRAVSRAESIPQDVRDRIRGTHLDTGTFLDSLKPLTHEEQHAAVDRALEGWKLGRSAKPAPPEPPQVDPDEKQFEALKKAWNKASGEARRRFEVWLAE